MLLNFGGNVGLHGRMDNVIGGYYKTRKSVFGPTLTGVGLTPEGIENNPVMYELLSELRTVWASMPWRAMVWLMPMSILHGANSHRQYITVLGVIFSRVPPNRYFVHVLRARCGRCQAGAV